MERNQKDLRVYWVYQLTYLVSSKEIILSPFTLCCLDHF